ncbi:hypothetical protein DM02DRAFT_200151 [Periconia macrospinosa]|uniref:Sister chromatid separation protein-like protein n=1 Tax=Periconia macrospinosa TaxID=97972 RepID=A0A2V1DAK5_9PLEO|nr:hypothetical protein DM02DRAFT_200151 [Periconia macrospinosa]
MADARGEYWYFDPNVDANKILVPELRSILLKHGVKYPSSAKKPALVSLFVEHVLPQASQIQRDYARTKRSTRGIEDVPSSTASTTDSTPDLATEDETLIAPVTPRRTSRRTTRATTEEAIERPTPARRAKTPSRAIPTKHAREAEVDEGQQPAFRRPRKSSVPAVKKEPTPDPEAWHRNDVTSPFTQDNPFQSGSSPLVSETRDRRRKTLGFEHRERRKSETGRRRTFQPKSEQTDRGAVVSTRKSFEVPYRRTETDDEADAPYDSTDAGEEFSPDEQLEIAHERKENGQTALSAPARRKRRTKAAGTAKAFVSTLLFSAAVLFGGLWRQEKFDVGFCGVGKDYSTSLAGVEIPDAHCYRNLMVRCEDDFVKKDHPLSLGGLLPLPPTCEPDTEKTRKINQVADRAVKVLRTRRAQYECQTPDAAGKVVKSPDVSVEELKEEIGALKKKGMSTEAFEDLFQKAIGETTRRTEVVESTDGETGKQQLSSTSLAELPLVCSIKRSLRETLERHILTVVIIILTIASGSYGKYSFTKNRAMEARAKQLASDVFNHLANQAALARHDPSTYQDRGLSMNQLRDDVLRDEFSAARRIKLWQKVQKKVENNANVRAAVREGQSGDITRMWEWTGPVHLLEEGHSSGKRDGGRYSLGGLQESPLEAKEIKDRKQWDEGHPVY